MCLQLGWLCPSLLCQPGSTSPALDNIPGAQPILWWQRVRAVFTFSISRKPRDRKEVRTCTCFFMLRVSPLHSVEVCISIFIYKTDLKTNAHKLSCLPIAILKARLQFLAIWHSEISLTIKSKQCKASPGLPSRDLRLFSIFPEGCWRYLWVYSWMQRVDFAEAKSTAFWVIKPFVLQPQGKWVCYRKSLMDRVSSSQAFFSVFRSILSLAPLWAWAPTCVEKRAETEKCKKGMCQKSYFWNCLWLLTALSPDLPSTVFFHRSW